MLTMMTYDLSRYVLLFLNSYVWMDDGWIFPFYVNLNVLWFPYMLSFYAYAICKNKHV